MQASVDGYCVLKEPVQDVWMAEQRPEIIVVGGEGNGEVVERM